MDKFQLQKYCSLRQQKLSILNSLHFKNPPSFFLTCISLLILINTIYISENAMIAKDFSTR